MPLTIKIRLKARQPAASFSISKLQLLEWESSNRQIYQRIDSHGIIVLERFGTFQHYSCLGGTCSDINRAEAPGTAAGMGSRNSRLQE